LAYHKKINNMINTIKHTCYKRFYCYEKAENREE